MSTLLQTMGNSYRTSDFKCINYKGLKGRDLAKAHALSVEFDFNMIAIP
jgi:hypothetical protein